MLKSLLFCPFLFLLMTGMALHAQTPIFQINQKLGKGMNMGNMFEAPSEGQWGNPYREDFFEKIASLGFDHVRIPIRWDTPERCLMTAPYTINPEFLSRIKSVVDRALDEDLMVIINMHHHDLLFEQPILHKDRFLAQWEQIAEFFKDYREDLLLEVLNEPHADLTPALWNDFFAEALLEIRKSNPQRAVLMGTAEFGGLSGLSQLEPPQDNNLIVTVHYYNPFQFTHQGADWVGEQSNQWLGTKWFDLEYEREAIEQGLEPLVAFSKRTNLPVHMGEFGAFSAADLDSRIRWTRYLARYFESLEFSWAYWEWSAGFGIFNPENNQYIQPLTAALLYDPLPEPQSSYPSPIYTSDFGNSVDGWQLFMQQSSQAVLVREQKSLRVNIQNPGTENWHIQLVKNNINLEKDKIYRVSFKASSNENKAVTQYAGKASPPYSSYSDYHGFTVTEEEKEFSYVFTMNQPSDADSRLVFDLGRSSAGFIVHSVKIEQLNFLLVAIPNVRKEKPLVYPNPLHHYFFIENISSGTPIEIYNIQGILLNSLLISENPAKISMENLSPGIFILKIGTNGFWNHYRLIKE